MAAARRVDDTDVLHFGHFEISPAERVLRIDGQPAALGARAFDLLLALAQRRERLVSKQELLDLVWPGVVVEEGNITTQMSTLRKLLGAQAIATVPGRGYRFTAQPSDEAAPAASAAQATPLAPAPPQRTCRASSRRCSECADWLRRCAIGCSC
jgi:DNA-binding winged helix-turn-helix (wHTH) protein